MDELHERLETCLNTISELKNELVKIKSLINKTEEVKHINRSLEIGNKMKGYISKATEYLKLRKSEGDEWVSPSDLAKFIYDKNPKTTKGSRIFKVMDELEITERRKDGKRRIINT